MPASAFALDRSTVEHRVRANLACAASSEQLTRALRLPTHPLRDRPRASFGMIQCVRSLAARPPANISPSTSASQTSPPCLAMPGISLADTDAGPGLNKST